MLVASSLSKQYATATGPVRVLDQVSFELHRGDAAAVTGPSGCGKSTLLHLLGALDTPTSGSVTLDGQNAFSLSESAQALFRNDKIGFVFQDHCLLPQCTVLENVLAPTLIAKPDPGVNDRAEFLIDRVGLSTRATHKPAELSGGEKQRVAIARALIRNPILLLADEPTGNLDEVTAESIAKLLFELHKENQAILLCVTHSSDLAARFPIRFRMHRRLLERS